MSEAKEGRSMSRINRKTAMLAAVVVAVTAIVVSNLLPGSAGTASGEGSSLASKIAFSIGAVSALVFLGLLAVAAFAYLVRRRNTARAGA
jgi:hypothetical protein